MTAVVSAGQDRRQYVKPPIKEALCEIRFFDSSEELDPLLPGRLAEHLEGYEGSALTMSTVAAGLHRAGEGQTTFQVGAGPTRVGLTSQDGKRIFSVGPGVIGFHGLEPYEGWESFRGRIEQGLGAWAHFGASISPSRIGIRYVNEFHIPGKSFSLGEYFNLGFVASEALPESFSGFFTRVEYIVDDATKLGLTFASIAVEGTDESAFLLDLDVSRDCGSDFPGVKNNVMAEVERLRTLEREYFESIITEQARGLFDE